MSATTTMTAIGFSRPGGPEVLEALELPVPEPGPGEVRVRTAAADPAGGRHRGGCSGGRGPSPAGGRGVRGRLVLTF